MFKVMRTLLLGSMLLLVQSCAQVPVETKGDPWEGFNRSMFAFNDAIDGAVLKPVAKGYKAVTPTPIQKGVSNFFSNLGEIGNITNNLLQGKWDATASSTFRFLINSTAGWFGIFDVAKEMGLEEKDEDFGQTLGYWGVSSGPYLVLPFLGPSTVRDGSGLVVQYAYLDDKEMLDLDNDEKLQLLALDVVETRARFLNAEGMIIGDRYSFIRDVYLQNRAYEVYDGNPPRQKKEAEETSATGDSWDVDDADDSWGDDTASDSWSDDTASDSWSDDTASDSWGDDSASDSWGDDSASDSWGDDTATDSWGDDSATDSWGDGTATDSWGDDTANDSLDGESTSDTVVNDTVPPSEIQQSN